MVHTEAVFQKDGFRKSPKIILHEPQEFLTIRLCFDIRPVEFEFV
jgi:hypothetical protein